ncbi:MAG: translation initiation factor IF-2 [Candidatus Melainabacteria bacterium RIFCSPHIGHO2_02_FULL_34_12]|nr:MAG: translation initiation factor IF-2 [Candidatus Melainabacteria bacterium RIFCSPHIGHO2_02_FULL_34_12]
MTITKPRVYDLARAITLDEADQKTRKQKQTDITKQIISICEGLGYPVKNGSSSIDEGLITKIIPVLNQEGFNLNTDSVLKGIKEQVSGKKSKSAKSEEVVQEPVPPPKKQLKIVRRIKPTPVVVEETPPEPLASEVKQVTIIKPTIKEETFPRIIKEEPKPPQIKTPSEPSNISQANKLKSIETRKPYQPSAQPIQPFRVAKPTMVPSMMGRTKRPHAKGGHQQKEKEKKETETVATITKPVLVTITNAMTVKELAERLILPETEVVKNLFAKKIIKTVNQTVELEIAIECAKSFGYEVSTKIEEEEKNLQPDISTEADEDLVPRPPVVTIMGHVDHGKTTLLDAIRETKFKITEQESGGITQHIGAYQVEIVDYDGNKRKITFLDTPGHEAFTAMRARGAQVTDIAILVVAADDGVMPQTIEAIDHAKAAGVPIVIALNKIDKDGAQPDKILGQLTEHDLLIEDYGGKTVCAKISAKKRLNLDDLLTKITLVADAELSQKLRANPNRNAAGAVIEAQLSKERGPIAHLLVQNGTLKKGDCLVAGKVAGRVRAMFNDHGKEIEEAPPSMPIEIIGLPDVPNAGDTFQVYDTYQKAKEIAQEKQIKEKERHRAFGLVDFASKVREGQIHELKIIVKADVKGSAEAVAKEIINLSTKDVLVRLIHVGTGNISENDINLAASTGAILIGFHVSVDPNAQKIAQEEGVDVRIYEIIYKITEDLEKAVLGLLEPEKEEVKLGAAEIRKIFTYGKGSKIAGSYVTEGKIQRNQIAKLIRDGKVIHEGKIDNLKRFKDDAREVQTGFECGISFEGFNGIEEGDKIECWTIIEKERTS